MLGIATLASGCVVRERVVYSPPLNGAPPPGGEVVVNEPPPAPLVESYTVAPDPTFVWVGGVWIWRGGWIWEPGHWAHPPRPGAVWIGPRYVFRGGRHVWVRGYWR
ncbi:MAG TPA: hypothetical protein VG754_12590 [Verrucomicrobiae bacterium]|jgi:hypothetical protein|nr:hypothetical protein [Verrucomicrobiae bacterium]